MIFCTVYVSVAAEPWDQADLTALLAQSRTANAAVDVTGLLLYRDDVFMQVLEGEEEVVRALYRRIAADPRHHDVANIWVAHAPRRRFPDWSMGFRHLEHDELALEGHRDLLAKPLELGRLGRRDAVARVLAHVAPSGPDGAPVS
ncbi:BLUF domain-containing protein [Microlunatus antarcticus]|uniref:BLUF domain-containing protein n=1 Tax=Microlunatus antarcticus TaxID=53388 RepID=A0A7W5JVN0_9ACTN|nr:hypothetical protein [Microlunatus antarcticus]